MRNKAKVLVVDDETAIRELVISILGDEKFRFIEAGDGQEALDKVDAEKPDLIILDLMLPRIDGLEVCRKLKDSPKTNHIPVIMLTVKDELADKIVGNILGADEYITKPFDPQELEISVKKIVQRIQPQ